jgi:hypothetical protein
MPVRLVPARLFLLIVLVAIPVACGSDGLESAASPEASTTTVGRITASTEPGTATSSPDEGTTTVAPDPTTTTITTTTASPGPGTALFRCATTNGKQIELVDHGEVLRYTFGPAGQPELVLDVDRDLATTYQWQGVGRNEAYSVDVPNPTATDGDYVYSLFWNYDKVVQESEALTAGVVVLQDGEPVATIECADPDTMTMNLIGVDLAPTP